MIIVGNSVAHFNVQAMIGLANHPTIALRRTETGSMALPDYE
jgi:hypothetical protein